MVYFPELFDQDLLNQVFKYFLKTLKGLIFLMFKINVTTLYEFEDLYFYQSFKYRIAI